MGKRKGMSDLQATVDFKGKRLRENGRLKRQHDLDGRKEIQNKLLRDAGVDEEMIETITDKEKQAIVKAIIESDPQLNKDVMVIERESPSNRMKENPLLSLNETEDTQPPMQEEPYCQASSSQIDAIHSKMPQETEISQDKIFKVEPLDCKSQDGSDSSSCHSFQEGRSFNLPLEEETTQSYEIVEVATPELASEVGNYRKSPREPHKLASEVLAVETQISPYHRRHESDIDLVPESPSSVNCDKRDDDSMVSPNDERVEDHFCPDYEVQPSIKNIDELKNRCMNQISVLKEQITFQNSIPRYAVQEATDPSLYSQVIKLMFDIYMRRLRSAQSYVKSRPEKWGKPVRTGVHCENLLRREVQDPKDTENGTKKGKGRRVMRKRPVKENDIDIVPSCEQSDKEKESCEKMESCSMTIPVINQSIHSAHKVDIPNKIDRTKMIDCCDQGVVKETVRNVLDAEKETSLKNFNRRKRRSEVIIVKPDGEQDFIPDLIPAKSSLKSKSEKKVIFQESDIEILEDEETGRERSWLRSVKGERKKRVTAGENKKCKTKKCQSDSPSIFGKNDFNRKLDNGINSRLTFSGDVYCSMNESSNSDSLPDINQLDKSEKTCNEKYAAKRTNEKVGVEVSNDGEALFEVVQMEDIPSSLESATLLNAEGDMYCTQIVSRSKRAGREKKIVVDEIFHPSTSSAVLSLGCLKEKSRKKRTGEVRETYFEERATTSGIVKKNAFSNDGTDTESLNCVDFDTALNVDSEGHEEKSSSFLKGKTKNNGKNKRKKRKLFDEESYEFAENLPKQITTKNGPEEGKQVERETDMLVDGVVEDEKACFECPATEVCLSTKDLDTERNVDQGSCPICDKVFPLTELEAHASSCGEVMEENERYQLVKCMICHKEINRKVLKEHQMVCASAKSPGEQLPTRRITRAKNSGHKKKCAFLKEKSPSSSGEDYGELVIEVEKNPK